MKKIIRVLPVLLPLLLLSACRIDLTINGDGAVQTENGSFDCSTGNSGDCVQSYVTEVEKCPGYVPPLIPTDPKTIPANCTVIVADYATCTAMTNEDTTNCVADTGVSEIFHALAGDGSEFTYWGGDNLPCKGVVSQICGTWISAENAGSDTPEEPNDVDIEANFTEDTVPTAATYTYNHLGQRKTKTVGGITTYFVYSDLDGQMLGEYQPIAAMADAVLPIREYLYVEGERVAMYTYDYTAAPTVTKAITYFANNQVGQTVLAWNADGNLAYERNQTPFGESKGEYAVNGTKVPLRFPGQYYDSESGFSQNHHRDYDSSIGRYIQPDKLDVLGETNDPQLQAAIEQGLLKSAIYDGLNHPYAYASLNPVMLIDPYGLSPECNKDPKCKPPKRPTKAAMAFYLLCKLLSKTDDNDEGGSGGSRPPPNKPRDPPPKEEPDRRPPPDYPLPKD